MTEPIICQWTGDCEFKAVITVVLTMGEIDGRAGQTTRIPVCGRHQLAVQRWFENPQRR